MTTQPIDPGSPYQPAGVQRCPECNANCAAGDVKCWLCRRDLSHDTPILATIVEPVSVNVAQFSLDTLMLLITLSAVLLGAFVAAPGLGILLAIVVAPALLRTFTIGVRRKKRGGKLTTGEKVAGFIGSFGLMAAIGLVGCTTFVIICFGGVMATCAVAAADQQLGRQNLEVVGFIVGVLAVVAALAIPIWLVVFMMRATWPKP